MSEDSAATVQLRQSPRGSHFLQRLGEMLNPLLVDSIVIDKVFGEIDFS
jgi:hypothetical protein